MAKKHIGHNAECKSELHSEHLCYIISQGFHLSEPKEYEVLVKKPRFKCEHCGRVANSNKHLCEPVEL